MSSLLCLKSTQFLSSFKELLSLAVPLSLNRVIINFLQSIEAIFIPQQLLKYGCSTSQALSVYGVLTGMALPLILFPGAITNSNSCVLLLPMVSEADAVGNRNKIAKAIQSSIRYGFLSWNLLHCVLFLLWRISRKAALSEQTCR